MSAPARQALQARAQGQSRPPAATQENDAYFQFLLGRRLEANGDVENAIKAFQRAALADPASAEIPAELAALYTRQNRFREALASAEAALKLDASNVEAHRVLGMVYAQLANPDDPSSRPDADRARYAAEAIRHLEAVARTPERPMDPGVQLLLARLYMATRQFDKAIPALEEFLGQEGDYSDAVEMLAEAYTATGQLERAVTILARAAQADPQFYPTLAEAYEHLRRWKDAADAYDRALKFYPANDELKTRRAVALLSAPDAEGASKARDLLAEILKNNPTDSRVLYLMAQAQRATKDLEGAEQTARRLMQLMPGNAAGAGILAEIYADRGEPAKVIALLQPLLSGPQPGQAGIPAEEAAPLLVSLGFAYQETGQLERAISAFDQARKQTPADPMIAVYLAQVNLEAGHAKAALDLVREARAGGVDNVRVARLEADALSREGRLDEGAAIMKKAIAAHPDDPVGYVLLAELYLGGEQHAEALRLLDEAGKKFPDDLMVAFQRGAALERAKRFSEAEAAFRQVIARDPLNALALNYLGYMMADRGDRIEEAIGYIKRALAIEPRNGAYLDSLGWAYFKQNKLDLAETNLRVAAELRVRDSAVQDHFGDVLERRGRFAEAVEAWNRALAGDGDQVDRAAIQKKIAAAKGKIKAR